MAEKKCRDRGYCILFFSNTADIKCSKVAAEFLEDVIRRHSFPFFCRGVTIAAII